jgi:hypothetical protein
LGFWCEGGGKYITLSTVSDLKRHSLSLHSANANQFAREALSKREESINNCTVKKFSFSSGTRQHLKLTEKQMLCSLQIKHVSHVVSSVIAILKIMRHFTKHVPTMK